MKVYISGPYTKGDIDRNVGKAIFYGDWIASCGHTVYIPHLSHFWDKLYHHEWEFWMRQDLEWVRACDAVFRIEGESTGADMEVALAEELGKPVFYDIFELERKL
jgi:hypothetical protein